MGDRVVHVGSVGGPDYDLRLKDGGRVEFRTINGVRRVAKYIVDPYGQTTTLEYITNGTNGLTLKKIIEPAGRYLEINYYTFPAWETYPVA